MRKIIVLSFITLDGVMQAPGGPQEDTDGGFEYGGWVVPYFDERGGQIMHEQMTKPRDLLLGRRTYEIFASYWPTHERVARHQFRDKVCCFKHPHNFALGQHCLYQR